MPPYSHALSAPLNCSSAASKCKNPARANHHLDTVPIAIFDNAQDIDALARHIEHYAQERPLNYGFLLRGHGLTCWGRDVAEARRHLEGWKFLFECEMQRRLLEK